MEYIKCSEENPLPPKFITIKGMDGYETYKIDDNTMGVRPVWISVKDKLPENNKVLAIFKSEKNVIYNMRHDGWFRNTIYSCRMRDNQFIIESHGPILPATHWMPLPNPPEITNE